jgi:hypothetical protein
MARFEHPINRFGGIVRVRPEEGGDAIDKRSRSVQVVVVVVTVAPTGAS